MTAITIDQAENLLIDEVVNAFGFLVTDVKAQMAFGNKSFDPPNELFWLRVDPEHNASEQGSLGGRFVTRNFPTSGILSVQIFTLSNNGRKEANEKGNILTNYLRDTTLSDIELNDITFRPIGVIEDGKWYQSNVTCNFTYHLVRPGI